MFNGNIGISKAVMAEMTDSTNVAQGTKTYVPRSHRYVDLVLKYLHSYPFNGVLALHSGEL
jgi:hypothetical protein